MAVITSQGEIVTSQGEAVVAGVTSYNSLLADSDLISRWSGDANEDSVGDANDAVSSNDGAWIGTEAYGDGEYDGVKSFDFNGSNYLSISDDASITPGNDSFSISCSLLSDNATPTRFAIGKGNNFSTTEGFAILTAEGKVYVRAGDGINRASQGISISNATRYSVVLVFDRTAETILGYLNGTNSGWTSGGAGPPDNDISSIGDIDNTDAFQIGSTVSGGNLVGTVEDVRYYSRALTATEATEIDTGPEPIYISGASLASNGAYDVGTWDNQSNGSINYEWVVVTADGTLVDSGTGSSGDADLLSVIGQTCYLQVRATNDGDYDVGDFSTRTADYGFFGDGYYEIAVATETGYDYIPSNVTIPIYGSSPSVWYKFYLNDIAYTRLGIENNRLDKICVKKIILNYNQGELVKVYIDTFNAAWLEEELYTLSEAQALL
jgi:hypothetical protein